MDVKVSTINDLYTDSNNYYKRLGTKRRDIVLMNGTIPTTF